MVSALGIDVAKDKLDGVLVKDAQQIQSGVFANNPKVLSSSSTVLMVLAPKAIVVAAIRKLLHLVYGVLRSGRPFDPHYVIQGSVA